MTRAGNFVPYDKEKGVVMAEEKILKSLEDFNSDQGKRYTQEVSTKNGIACPKCGSELIDTNPSTVLASCPPQKNISCEDCDYTGYRIA